MAERSARSIGRSIVGPATVILVVVQTVLGMRAWFRLSEEAERVETTRAQITAQALAASEDVSMAVSPGDAPSLESAARTIQAAMARDAQVAYVVLTGPKGVVASRFRSDPEGSALRADAGALQKLEASVEPGAPQLLSSGSVDMVIASGDVAFSGLASADLAPPPVGAPIGRLFVGISMQAEAAARRKLLVSTVLADALGVALYVAAMLWVVRRVSRRMSRVTAIAHAVQGGDLTARTLDPIADEVGQVARAFDEAAERIARIVGAIGEAADAVEANARRIGGAAQTVRGGAVDQRQEADGASRIADEVAGALQEIARRTEAAQAEARSGAAATARISVAVDGVAQGIDEAVRAVEGTADAAAGIARSINDIAGRAEEVAGAAASTSSAILELNTTIHRVRETAEAAARLADHAGGDAERGQDALAATLEGIDRIHEASSAIRELTAALERRTREIGGVLSLVGELTERTNLLALNASIIAAQAGVEGRGFAVVAAEIKELSRRTASSAGEIAQLVAGIEEDAAAARRAAEVGAASVDDGRERARATAAALGEIFTRVRDSAQLSLSIATATDEQVRASRYVADRMNEVTASVDQIARATAEQKRQGEQAAQLTTRLRDLVRTVGEAIREQRNGAREVAAAVDALRASFEQVAVAHRARAGDGARLREAMARIRAAAGGHEGAVDALEKAVAELQAQASSLGGQLDRLHT